MLLFRGLHLNLGFPVLELLEESDYVGPENTFAWLEILWLSTTTNKNTSLASLKTQLALLVLTGDLETLGSGKWWSGETLPKIAVPVGVPGASAVGTHRPDDTDRIALLAIQRKMIGESGIAMV